MNKVTVINWPFHDFVYKSYEELFSIDNIYEAWLKYKSGKSEKFDNMVFERNLEEEIFRLHDDLTSKNYRHSNYTKFVVHDGKKRTIHKALVRDRVVHQIIYDYLMMLYKLLFINDSYASLKEKGTEKAVSRLKFFLEDEAVINFGKCFALKCDIRKYFDSIDHEILFSIISQKIKDKEVLNIIKEIIESYNTFPAKGIPLGNMTSQIFANIYLHDFDCFVKKDLQIRKYVRYNDDFIMVFGAEDKACKTIPYIMDFINKKRLLCIPESKISVVKFNWGVEFLGRIIMPKAVILRKKTLAKAFHNITKNNLSSYFGLFSHTSSFDISRKLRNKVENFDNISY